MNFNVDPFHSLMVVFFVLFLIGILGRYKIRFINRFINNSHRVNLYWIVVWTAFLIFILMALYDKQIITCDEVRPMLFPKSKVDGIIAIGFILAVIGTVWAVKAAIQSEKAYNALGSTFDFTSFLDEHKLPEVIKQIGEPSTIISLYIGFPIVGLPYYKNKNLRTKPITIFNELIGKLGTIKRNIETKETMSFSLNIGYINIEKSKKIIEDKNNIDVQEKIVFINLLIEFYDLIDYFKNKKHPNIKVLEFDLNEKFRFVANHKIKKQAYVWMVDFKEDSNGKIEPFDSVVFQTEEDKFVTLLENVF